MERAWNQASRAIPPVLLTSLRLRVHSRSSNPAHGSPALGWYVGNSAVQSDFRCRLEGAVVGTAGGTASRSDAAKTECDLMRDGIKLRFQSDSERFELEVDRRTLIELLVGGGLGTTAVTKLLDDAIERQPSEVVVVLPLELRFAQGSARAVATDADGNEVSTAQLKPLDD